MKVLALVSGGKDSIMSMLECQRMGHEIIALAHLRPPEGQEETDSWMFQSVGSTIAAQLGECMGLPMYVRTVTGDSGLNEMEYEATPGNEVEDLHALVSDVLTKHPDIGALCSGAILSDYQRTRVENVCGRLGLLSLAYLWRRDQRELLDEMITSGVEAVLVKVAGMGLNERHLGKTLEQMRPHLHKLHDMYGSHICGEGGEYETITLDCPLFKKRIQLADTKPIVHSADVFAPVVFLRVDAVEIRDKERQSPCDDSESAPLHAVGDSSEQHGRIAPIMPQANEWSANVVPLPKPLATSDAADASQAGLKVLGGSSTSAGGQLERNTRRVGEQCMSMVCGGDPGNDKDLEGEVARVMEALVADVGEAGQGFSIDDAVCIWLYVHDLNRFQRINAVFSRFVRRPPVRICVQLDQPELLRVVCFCDRQRRHRTVRVQSISYWAPATIGPYAQSVALETGLLHTSGSIPLVAPRHAIVDATGLDHAGRCRIEAHQCLTNLNPVLDLASGKTVEGLCRVELYIASGTDVAAVAEEWALWGASWSDSSSSDSDDGDDSTPVSEGKGDDTRSALLVTVPRMPRDALVEAAVSALFSESQSSVTRDRSDSGKETSEDTEASRIITHSSVVLPAPGGEYDQPGSMSLTCWQCKEWTYRLTGVRGWSEAEKDRTLSDEMLGGLLGATLSKVILGDRSRDSSYLHAPLAIKIWHTTQTTAGSLKAACADWLRSVPEDSSTALGGWDACDLICVPVQQVHVLQTQPGQRVAALECIFAVEALFSNIGGSVASQ